MAQVLGLGDLVKLNIIHRLLKMGSVNHTAAQECYLEARVREGCADHPGLLQSLMDLIVSDYPDSVTDTVLDIFTIKQLKFVNLKNCRHVTISMVSSFIQRSCNVSVLILHDIPDLFLHPSTVERPHSDQTSAEGEGETVRSTSMSSDTLRDTLLPCSVTLTRLSNLDLSGCTSLTDEILQYFLSLCSTLQHLNIKRCQTLTENAFHFSSSNQDQPGCSPAHTTANQCVTSAPQCQLQTVIITGNKKMTSATLSDIMHLFHKSLQSLDISSTGAGCRGMFILCGFNTTTTEKLTARLHPPRPNAGTVHPDPDIESIFQSGHCLCPSTGETEGWLGPQSEPCRHRSFRPAGLQVLGVQDCGLHCTSCGHACLSVLFRNYTNLRSAALSGLSGDDTLRVIIKNGAQLRKLNLLESIRLTDDVLSMLPEACPLLEELDLRGVSFMGDEGLVKICEGYSNKRLNKLYLAECRITDKGLQDIVSHLSDQIHTLDLSWCEDVTDGGLMKIAESCTHLRVLHLRTLLITKHMLNVLADNCQSLTELNISSGQLTELQDDTLRTLSEKLTLLQIIDISWNSDLTDESVECVLRNCCQLRKAVFCGVKRLTYKPFLPIISDLKLWERCKSFLRLKLFERTKRQSAMLRGLDLSDDGSSDEEYENIHIPARSTTYAPRLKLLDLSSCDFVNDYVLNEITVVSRGSLLILDYYNSKIPASLAHLSHMKSLQISDYE